ncbi:MAG TPA: hypothetical protein VMK82_04880 [Steroidobacteraceae bacterium]|nr:hypothetical protein [Steroidobacteraceae bacterium]
MSQKHAEVKYAEEHLLELGYKAAIFSFDLVPDQKLGSQVEPPVTDVMVRNTENNAQKVYPVAGEKPWSARFLDDIRAGEFGSAPKGLDEDPERNVAIVGVRRS